MEEINRLKRAIRYWIVIFIVGLLLSGITAFPLETELRWLNGNFDNKETGMGFWINKVYTALKETNEHYPFLAYGYDWLAFAHLVIAVAFIGPLRDPVRNIWVIQFGMIACCMIFPLALIAGPIRGIPFYWQLIDCSFGIIGFAVLALCYRKILMLQKLQSQNRNNCSGR
jgi:hypothetical protein